MFTFKSSVSIIPGETDYRQTVFVTIRSTTSVYSMNTAQDSIGRNTPCIHLLKYKTYLPVMYHRISTSMSETKIPWLPSIKLLLKYVDIYYCNLYNATQKRHEHNWVSDHIQTRVLTGDDKLQITSIKRVKSAFWVQIVRTRKIINVLRALLIGVGHRLNSNFIGVLHFRKNEMVIRGKFKCHIIVSLIK